MRATFTAAILLLLLPSPFVPAALLTFLPSDACHPELARTAGETV